MAVTCTTPAVTCNAWYLQSPAMQNYLLLQLLCAIATELGISVTCTNAGFEELAEPWLCQGSPAKINYQAAQLIADNLPDVDLSQPVCLTPLQLAGANAALICSILDNLTTT